MEVPLPNCKETYDFQKETAACAVGAPLCGCPLKGGHAGPLLHSFCHLSRTEVHSQQRLEKLPMVGDLQVEQFFHDDAPARRGGLAQQLGVEGDPPLCRTASPLAAHRPKVDLFRLDPYAPSPRRHLRTENITRHRLFKFLPHALSLPHADALRSMRNTPLASSTTPSAPASISAL